MSNNEHMTVLKRGVKNWNEWRKAHPQIQPDLSRENFMLWEPMYGTFEGIDFRQANLSYSNFLKANLSRADFTKANLHGTEFLWANGSAANLSEAKVTSASLVEANFSEANFYKANLIGANLARTNLARANLEGANLRLAHLVDTNLEEAKIIDCEVYGSGVWRVKLTGAKQSNLIISDSTYPEEPIITVDNLEVAQFISLLLHNERIREIIDTITSKVVLILGRFTSERKVILDTLREELRLHNYSPVLFDFQNPVSRDLTETITLLARMARFILADITEPSSIPHELASIIPHLPSVPVLPLLHISAQEYGMFEHLQRYPWVLTPYPYEKIDDLLISLRKDIIEVAEHKVQELRTTREK